MQRAAILIGVRKADHLPMLEAVWGGVLQMEAWARAQGIDDDHLVTITDRDAPVDSKAIKRAVRRFVEEGTVEQLIVYFAGHGVNNARSEYWLLSDAIVDPDEAVNVTGSEDLARQCTIPHVVFFSDACRTAASGIQAQGITGDVIFPNLGSLGSEKQIDLFFASALGQPALEIQRVDEATRGYRTVYTDTLVEELGERSTILEPDPALGCHVVRPWPLKRALASKVPERVFAATQRTQQPDARITSCPEAWLAKVRAPRAPRRTTRGVPDPAALSASIETFSHRELRVALSGGPTRRGPVPLAPVTDRDAATLQVFSETADLAARLFGPLHFETGCGFKVLGDSVRNAWSAEDVHLEVLGADRDLVRVALKSGRPSTVLLELEGGCGVALPAIQDFLAALVLDRGELMQVSYDPSEYSWRWPEFDHRRSELLRLRGVVAASSRLGTFRLEDEESAEMLARAMQLSKAYDPTLAVYAAYAYRDRGLSGRIRDMERYQRDDLGVSLFDIALLARRLNGTSIGDHREVLPALPLLSQGWPLLSSRSVTFPRELEALRKHARLDSLWTLYDASGVALLRKALKKGWIQ